MTDLDEALAGTMPEAVTSISTAKPRRHRHVYDIPSMSYRLPESDDGNGYYLREFKCGCGAIQDPAASRRGKSARRLGSDTERRIERIYGPVKMGEHNLPVDHLGRDWKWQSKATRAAPPVWLTAIDTNRIVNYLPRYLRDPLAYAHRYNDGDNRRAVVIRSFVHAGLRTRDWLFIRAEDAWYPAPDGSFVIIEGSYWLDYQGKDTPTNAMLAVR